MLRLPASPARIALIRVVKALDAKGPLKNSPSARGFRTKAKPAAAPPTPYRSTLLAPGSAGDAEPLADVWAAYASNRLGVPDHDESVGGPRQADV